LKQRDYNNTYGSIKIERNQNSQMALEVESRGKMMLRFDKSAINSIQQFRKP